MSEKITIKVKGHLDEKWKEWFHGMEIIIDGENTIITGNATDQAFIHGVLNKIRDLNLTLLCVITDSSCK